MPRLGPIVEIEGTVQHYDWGKVGRDSKVAQLVSCHCSGPVEDKPYAEVRRITC